MASNLSLKDIRSLLEMLETHDVTEFRLVKGEERLWLRRGEQPVKNDQPSVVQPVVQPVIQAQPAPQPAPPPAQASQPEAAVNGAEAAKAPSPLQAQPAAQETSAKFFEIKSPMVGTFYRRPAVDADPYVEVGDSVKKGDVLCIVEAMKLMNEIECEITGRLKEICLEDGQMVEFGEVLFRVEVG